MHAYLSIYLSIYLSTYIYIYLSIDIHYIYIYIYIFLYLFTSKTNGSTHSLPPAFGKSRVVVVAPMKRVELPGPTLSKFEGCGGVILDGRGLSSCCHVRRTAFESISA